MLEGIHTVPYIQGYHTGVCGYSTLIRGSVRSAEAMVTTLVPSNEGKG